ncbi:DegV domain-containing protein [Clostridiales bacterium]|nr:DegV domain-containing protein [Clostridiales bacterium]
MSYKIILDSCGELTEEMLQSGNYSVVPLTLQVDDTVITDDETFDQANFLRLVASTTACPKSACPSPEQYMSAYECGCDHIFVVTLSSQLSGSYNSAVLAKRLFEETNPAVNIHVFDSCSASAGQTLLALKADECERTNMDFENTVEEVKKYKSTLSTLFVLEDLSFLERNGRLTGLKKLTANLLHIVPIMAGTREGTICQLGQARGIKNAMSKLLDIIISGCTENDVKKLVIAHCSCPERAEELKKKILEKIPTLTIYINNTRGIASLYAGNKGIIVAY